MSASVITEDKEEARVILAPRVVWAASSILRAVEGQVGSGFAESEGRDDKSYSLTMRLNLLPEEDGTYEAWLVREGEPGVPPGVVSLGTLESPNGDGSYYLSYHTAELNLRDHKKVAITWEPLNDPDPGPSDLIVEGTLTVIESD